MTDAGWTREAPKVPGWYWWKEAGCTIRPLLVSDFMGEIVYQRWLDDDPAYVTSRGGEWYGPLEVPQ